MLSLCPFLSGPIHSPIHGRKSNRKKRKEELHKGHMMICPLRFMVDMVNIESLQSKLRCSGMYRNLKKRLACVLISLSLYVKMATINLFRNQCLRYQFCVVFYI